MVTSLCKEQLSDIRPRFWETFFGDTLTSLSCAFSILFPKLKCTWRKKPTENEIKKQRKNSVLVNFWEFSLKHLVELFMGNPARFAKYLQIIGNLKLRLKWFIWLFVLATHLFSSEWDDHNGICHLSMLVLLPSHLCTKLLEKKWYHFFREKS